jgi:hypothetical protein
MEGIKKLHMDEYKDITNDWNFDISCVYTLFLISLSSTWFLFNSVDDPSYHAPYSLFL